MKKKLITLLTALLSVIFALGMLSGCALITTDSEADMKQIVAEVDVSKDKDSLSAAVKKVGAKKDLALSDTTLEKVGSTGDVTKRDLITTFLSYGYSYISAGYSYAEAFDAVLDILVGNKIDAQIAIAYYLNAGEVVVDREYVESTKGYTAVPDSDGMKMDKTISETAYADAIGSKTGDEAAIAAFSFFLTEDEINYAKYTVMQSINSAIDSYEAEIIKEESSDSSSSSSDRTVPTGANTLSSQYYPTNEAGELDYDIYTGMNLVSECGTYEKQDGSTVITRTRAYMKYIAALKNNYMIGADEDILDITSLAYYASQYKSQLEAMIVNKFVGTVALDMTDSIEEQMLIAMYDDLVTKQKANGSSSFTSTMDSAADDSFVVYSPDDRTYGFVVNILLPFSTQQEMDLEDLAASTNGETSKEYYAERNKLFLEIEAKDLRDSWFNGATDYSFDASKVSGLDYYKTDSNSDYLFFEDSYVTGKEGIDRYAGTYPYNGTVTYNEEKDEYELKANPLSIDEFLKEMNDYINFAVGSNVASGALNAGYGVEPEDFIKADGNGREIDYDKMVYYKGSVAGVAGVSKEEYMTEDSVAYKALSAFNELMFAYSTDTGCLNTYLGYSVTPKQESSSYVEEFTYAARAAILEGAGTYYVVGTEFGLHIVYVSYVYTGGEVYQDGFVYANRHEEGTFSYLFYQASKTEVASDYASDQLSDIVTTIENSDKIVVKHQSRYEDLRKTVAAQDD